MLQVRARYKSHDSGKNARNLNVSLEEKIKAPPTSVAHVRQNCGHTHVFETFTGTFSSLIHKLYDKPTAPSNRERVFTEKNKHDSGLAVDRMLCLI